MFSRSDHAARMKDGGEGPARTTKRARKRIGDRPEDEPTRRLIGEIDQKRGDEVAEIQLACLHEVSNPIRGRLKRADKALADTTADIARVVGIVEISRARRPWNRAAPPE